MYRRSFGKFYCPSSLHPVWPWLVFIELVSSCNATLHGNKARGRLLHCPWLRSAETQHNLSIWALTQEQVISTAGLDLTNPSTLTQTQWDMACSQLKNVYPKVGDNIPDKELDVWRKCSPRVAQVLVESSKKCSGTSKGNSQEEQMGKMMCQAVKTMASFVLACKFVPACKLVPKCREPWTLASHPARSHR